MRDAGELAGIGELRPAGGEIGPRGDQAGRDRGVERQDLVLGRLDPEELLELAQLVRMGRRDVVELGPVLGQVVQAPLVGIGRVRDGGADELLGRPDRVRAGDPAVVIDRPIAHQPTSSVMIRRMFGAPLGGTTRGAHQGFDWAAFRLISPPNGGAGAGSTWPWIASVAEGEPGLPVSAGPRPPARARPRSWSGPQ